MMQLLTFHTRQADANEFVAFWKRLYHGFDNAKYKAVVSKDKLDTEDIRKLFLWKNNMGEGLTPKKKVFIDYVIKEIHTVNLLKRSFSWSLFEEKFSKRGPVWIITLLHAINQNEFPIYDQHAYRAYSFIDTGKLVSKSEIPKSHQVFKVYKMYKAFFDRLKNQVSDYTPKEVDEALWAFGKFLSLYPQMISDTCNYKSFGI
jgi:hypothetical protein